MDWGLEYTHSWLDLAIPCASGLTRLGFYFVLRGHSELPSELVDHVQPPMPIQACVLVTPQALASPMQHSMRQHGTSGPQLLRSIPLLTHHGPLGQGGKGSSCPTIRLRGLEVVVHKPEGYPVHGGMTTRVQVVHTHLHDQVPDLRRLYQVTAGKNFYAVRVGRL